MDYSGRRESQECTTPKTEIDKLNRVVKSASYIMGTEMDSLRTIYEKRMKKRACNIVNDSVHPGNDYLELLPSGKRLRSIGACTNRLSYSFIPTAVRTFNSKS